MFCSTLQVMTMLLLASLLVILLASSGGTPYYITSSDDIIAGNICFFEGQSVQPCSTLETLAAKGISGSVFNGFGANVTVFFLPGMHIIRNDTDLGLSSIQTATLTPLKENEVLIE